MNIYTGFLRLPAHEVKRTKFKFSLIRTFCSEHGHDFPSISEIISEKNKNDCIKRIQSIRVSPRELTKDNRKRAAVLIPLCIIDTELSFLYTLRRANLKRHRGQVSFPGGIEDATDKSLVETALRETEEELGINKETVKVWGTGSIVVGNEFSVLPVLGYLGPLNVNKLKPNPDEVEMAFTIPLRHFCSAKNCKFTQFRVGHDKGMTVGRIIGIYQRALEKHPYRVQSLQAGFLLGLGDVISQAAIEPSERPYDYKRTVRFAIMGLAIGPVLQKWYGFLDKMFGTEKNLKTVVKKVAADQIIVSPVMLAVFLSAVTVLEGGGYNQIRSRIKRSYTDILLSNYKVWPAVQLITFSMPLNFRVLFVQSVALGWNTYLAWKINHKKVKKPT